MIVGLYIVHYGPTIVHITWIILFFLHVAINFKYKQMIQKYVSKVKIIIL